MDNFPLLCKYSIKRIFFNFKLAKKALIVFKNERKLPLIGCMLLVSFSVDKMAVLVDHILKIKGKFNEDRKKPSLNFNDEQIHKYDK